jgi:NADPH:quinone reductase
VNDVPDPTPGDGEVLIATEAATINPADLGIVTGAVAPLFPVGAVATYTPGWDLVGRVVAAGAGADGALVGCQLLEMTRHCGFASASAQAPAPAAAARPAEPGTGPAAGFAPPSGRGPVTGS